MDSYLSYSIFLINSLLCIIGGVLIFTRKKIIFSALGLFLCLLSLSGIYVFALADFVAVSQIVIYVGGILVLLIFALMFTYRSRDEEPVSGITNAPLGGLISLISFLGLVYIIIYQFKGELFQMVQVEEPKTTIFQMGKLLLTKHLLPFEFIGVFLLIVLIGSVFVASKKEQIKEN